MPYIVSAVESILDQTFQDFEFIIVDDGSVDDTPKFLKSLDDRRVKIVTLSENSGTSAASNIGLDNCGGKYIARMDADDISMPNRLERQVQYLDKNPEVGLVGTFFCYFGRGRSGAVVPLVLEHDNIMKALLRVDHALCHGTCMIRSDLLREIGGYWEFFTFDDWDMFLRIGERSRLANLNECLYQYRIRIDSLTGKDLRNARLHYEFAAECSQKRQQGLPSGSFQEFVEQESSRSWLKSAAEHIGIYSLQQYRKAVFDLCNGKPLLGRLRLAYAATCNPLRTFRRLVRISRTLR